MFPQQGKLRLRVIEGYFLPGGGLMAGGAVRAQCAGMRIVCFVAGETIRGSAFEELIQVAIYAGNIGVTLGKFENRSVVVEL